MKSCRKSLVSLTAIILALLFITGKWRQLTDPRLWILPLVGLLTFVGGAQAKASSSGGSGEAAFSKLTMALLDASTDFVYLKDENLNYMFVNEALREFIGLPCKEILGRNDAALLDAEFASVCTQTDMEALDQGRPVVSTTSWGGHHYRTTKFPVPLACGAIGVGGYISDITQAHLQRQQRERALEGAQLLFEVLGRSFASKQEQLDYALHRIMSISGSKHGYIYLYNEDKEELVLNSRSEEASAKCRVKDPQSTYQLASTGLWGEVVRQRKPIIVNNYKEAHPHKKGLPQGHIPFTRFMSVPVLFDDKIVAVLGLADKSEDYTETDVYETTMLMSGVWNAVLRRESSETLAYERNKYYQTLLSIGDGVMVVDANRNIEFANPVACKLTGAAPGDILGRPFSQVVTLSHEEESQTISDPVEGAFCTGQVQELGDHAVLTSRTGAKYFVEISAAPIRDESGAVSGVVFVFKDVTEKKEQALKIEYMSFHDSLTGLYNRRFFDEELKRLDTGRNLPITVILGDVNSLKLTNDIFGHDAGDELLKTVAQAMKRVCRADDIIARWGGDEFALLLPQTSETDAALIVKRLKREVEKHSVNAIDCSISLGLSTKSNVSEDIADTVNAAVANMYSNKTMARANVQKSEFASILNTLYESDESENRHSRLVGRVSREIGEALGLSESDLQRLEQAGRFHDIGKIGLAPGLAEKQYHPSPEESEHWKQHPAIGFRVLNYFDETLEVAETVLAHHENWDGSGYPRGLKGENIPLHARIVSVADEYSRLMRVQNRTEEENRREALKSIRAGSGFKFDPSIVEAFLNLKEIKGD